MSKLDQITCECDTEVACCTALNTEPIDTVQAEDFAEAFHALGDSYRMAIVHLIAATGEAVCVVDVERHLPVGQSTVSYHLKTLLDAGVIHREKRSKWNYYSLNAGRFDQLTQAMAGFRDRAVVAAA
jgi:ArsR family transcriptional regulator